MFLQRIEEAVIAWGGGCQSQKFWSPFLTPADRAGRRAHAPVALWIPTECQGPAEYSASRDPVPSSTLSLPVTICTAAASRCPAPHSFRGPG